MPYILVMLFFTLNPSPLLASHPRGANPSHHRSLRVPRRRVHLLDDPALALLL